MIKSRDVKVVMENLAIVLATFSEPY